MAERIAECPSCAHEIKLPAEGLPSHLKCPHCDTDIAGEDLVREERKVEEIAPGFRSGQEIGGYVIEELLGAGGMAVVFSGRQLSLDRQVAIKVLPKEFSHNPTFLERFEGEATALASLNHHNIVSVIDKGVINDTYFIVMELIEGKTLKDLLQRERVLDQNRALETLQQILNGLAYAHSRGVVHRDIKPGNIMINTQGVVKIADFGLAHLAKQRGGLELTQTSQTMGTLKYMAPEQLLDAKTVDGRADLYSLGVVMYEMMTGHMPLGRFKMPTEINPNLDVRLDDVILKALKMEPQERYATAKELAEALKDIASSPARTVAEEEAADQAVAPVELPPAMTACMECGHVSGPESETCEKCGASLSDLFDKCPNCGRHVRIDRPRCPEPECNMDLDAIRRKLRQRVEKRQLRVRKLYSQKRYDEALDILAKIAKVPGREYMKVRESAAKWAAKIERKRERYRSQTYDAGARAFAEGRPEHALQMWETLPDDYKDVGERRASVHKRLVEGRESLSKAGENWNKGDIEKTLDYLQQAAKIWPHNAEIRRQIIIAKNRIGDQSMKRRLIEESESAEKRGDLEEAISLTQSALDISPQDQELAQRLDDLMRDQANAFEAMAASHPTLFAGSPGARRPEPVKVPFALVVFIFVLLTLGIGIVVGVIMVMQEDTDAPQIQRFISEAGRMERSGDYAGAIAVYRRVASEFSDTLEAELAREELARLNTLLGAAEDAVREAARLRAEGRPGEAMALLDDFEAGGKYAGIRSLQAKAREEAKATRRLGAEASIAEAERLRRGRRLRQAASLYEKAIHRFNAGEQANEALARVREDLEDFEGTLARAGAALERGDIQEAAAAARAALDILPYADEGGALMSRIAQSAPPPEGMVLVPRGGYSVGGSAAVPREDFVVFYGFYIDEHEVSVGEYAEFLAASGHPAPVSWRTDPQDPASWSAPGGETEDGGGEMPVREITHEDATAYARWAGKRLPTEKEWEAAARGPEGRRYPWGDEWSAKGVNLGYDIAKPGAARADKSFCGALDMAGNLAEWVATPFAIEETESSDAEDSPPYMMIKGASWLGDERGRWSVAIFAEDDESHRADRATRPAGSDEQDPPLAVRAGCTRRPGRLKSAEHARTWRLNYVGLLAAGDSVKALIRFAKWAPQYGAWIGDQSFFEAGSPIKRSEESGIRVHLPEEAKRASEPIDVLLDTGCVLSDIYPENARLFAPVIDPQGVTRNLPRERPTDLPDINRLTIFPPSENAIPPAAPITLQEAASSWSRTVGVRDEGYINVGFRCVKDVYTPPAAPPAQDAPQE